MKVYLVRHGESNEMGSDDTRSLSDKGKDDIKALAKFISHSKPHVSRVVQSQKLRAQETAKILLTGMQFTGEIETTNDLDPLADLESILDEIKACDDNMLLVGHMPFMGRLLSQMLTKNEDKNILDFKRGSMVCLERTHHSEWVICWAIHPKLLP